MREREAEQEQLASAAELEVQFLELRELVGLREWGARALHPEGSGVLLSLYLYEVLRGLQAVGRSLLAFG